MKNTLFLSFLLLVIFCLAPQISSQEKPTTKQEKNKVENKKVENKKVENKKFKSPVAEFNTSMGKFEIALYPDKAPKAVENFVTHSEKGYYKDLIFHRVIPNFMIQGGDPTGTGRGGESIWGKPFEDETKNNLKFDNPGILAMANAGPNTNGSQFFITVAATPWLNGHHTIFGKVISGMDVVNSISEVKRNAQDKPLKDVVIKSITIKEKDQK